MESKQPAPVLEWKRPRTGQLSGRGERGSHGIYVADPATWGWGGGTTYKTAFPSPHSENLSSSSYKTIRHGGAQNRNSPLSFGREVSMPRFLLEGAGITGLTSLGTEKNAGFLNTGGWCQLASTRGWLASRRQWLAQAPVRGKRCSIVAAADAKVRERMRLSRQQLPRTELLRRNKAPHCSGRKGALSSNPFRLIHTPSPIPGHRHKKTFHQ